MRTRRRAGLPSAAWCLALLALLGAPACGFFDGADDELGVGDSETGGDETGDPPPPRRGFRVLPKYLLQDVPAVVVLSGNDGLTVAGCVVDELDGGYLCDADELASGASATVAVDRDGFEPAVRALEVPFNQIVTVEVHLAVAGGPSGVWSACTPAGELVDCDEVCAAQLDAPSCAVTSCPSDDPDAPIVTFESFADADCLARIVAEPAACDAALPAFETAAVRCCCAG